MARRQTNWGVTVLAIILIAALCIAGMWLWYGPRLDAAESQIASLHGQLATEAVRANVAHLDLTTANTFDFSVGITANGGVAADNTYTEGPQPTLTIDNAGTLYEARNVYITMWDPIASVGGVPTALLDTTMSFYLYHNGVYVPLYRTEAGVGAYTDGVNIGNLPVGAQTTLSFTAKVDSAPDGTYDDTGASYTVKAFVYQLDARHASPASWTLVTA